jgi:hypothetical protein
VPKRIEKLRATVDKLLSRPKSFFAVKSTDTADYVTSPENDVYYIIKREKDFLSRAGHINEYDLYDYLVSLDPDLNRSVINVGLMCATDYDFFVPHDMGEDRFTKDEEEEAIALARELDWQIGFEELFFDIPTSLVMYGDDVSKINFKNGSGITGLTSWPIKYITITEKGQKVGNTDYKVMSADRYHLNERNNNVGDNANKDLQTIERGKGEVFHLSFNSRGNWKNDRLGRKTYGIYSRSLIKPLETLIESKVNTLKNKVIWDHRSLPREVHKLPISEMFDPNNYSGSTWEDKKAAADSAAQSFVDQYKEDIEDPNADQGYIIPDNFEIEWIGPEGKMIDPTPFLEMTNRDIAAGMGMTTVGLGRETGTTRGSAYTAAEFTIFQAKTIQRKLKRNFQWLIKKHVQLRTKQEEVPKVAIAFEPLRLQDKTEVYRQVRYLTSVLTMNELRKLVGVNPLDESNPEDAEKIEEIHERLSLLRGSGVGGST